MIFLIHSITPGLPTLFQLLWIIIHNVHGTSFSLPGINTRGRSLFNTVKNKMRKFSLIQVNEPYDKIIFGISIFSKDIKAKFDSLSVIPPFETGFGKSIPPPGVVVNPFPGQIRLGISPLYLVLEKNEFCVSGSLEMISVGIYQVREGVARRGSKGSMYLVKLIII